jgi:O-antigen/teichoic acid export membrane protein
MSASPWRHHLRLHWADPLYRQSYYMLASTAVSAATGLLFWIVAARRALPEVVGAAAGMVAAIAFLSYLTSFALPYALLRFGGSARSGLLNLSVAFSTLTSFVAAAGFAFVSPLASPALNHLLRQPIDIALFAVAGAGTAASLLLDNYLAARQMGATALARNCIAGVLKLVLLFSVVAPGDPRALYLAVTMPALVSTAAVAALLPRLVPSYRIFDFHVDGDLRESVSFALRNYAGSLLSGAPQFALPLLALMILGTHQNAFFYVAWSMAQIIHLVPAVISNITLSQGAHGPAPTLTAKSRRFSFTLLAPLCAVGILFPSLILRPYGAAYVPGASVALRLLVVAALPWSLVVSAQAQFRIEHRYRTVTLLTGCFCVLSLGVPVALGAAFGTSGMAVGWLLAVLASGILAHRLTSASSSSWRRPPARTVDRTLMA